MEQEQLATRLAQMKDVSEMMVDLAYSSLLYGSEDVAEHVLSLEEKMDSLHTEFELAVLEIRGSRPAKGLLGLIRLGLATEELADAAAMIADLVKKGVRAHPIMRAVMERTEETIVATRVEAGSVMSQKSLGELGLEDDIGMRVIAVERGDEWTYNPADSFIIRPADLIIARGYTEGREKLLTLANPLHRHEQ
jgi:uncharacterized protein with PhoU and TrkA domain